ELVGSVEGQEQHTIAADFVFQCVVSHACLARCGKVDVMCGAAPASHIRWTQAGGAASCGSRWVGPSWPRSAANHCKTGIVPGSTGPTATGKVCQAICWPSRISKAPCQS